jgi:hypothetical protein
MTEKERKIWNDAIDSVLELMRLHPIHRIGEAAFMRRLTALRMKPKAYDHPADQSPSHR